MTTHTIRPIRQILRKCCLCGEKCNDCRWYEPLKGFLCPRCTMGPQSYTVANATHLGLPLKYLPAFSIEFEVSSSDREALQQALILMKYQYKRTSDGTVDDEYKSPIYHSLRAFRKPLAILHDLRSLVNGRCGTHLHVECRSKECLRAVHAEVFSPLLDHMLNHPKQTMQFWGRFFSRYATAPNSDRYHCFNLESTHPTLEFRLPRFRSAAQYLQVVRCCRTMVAYLDRTLAEVQQTGPSANGQTGQPEGGQKRRVMSPRTIGKHVLTLYKQYVNVLPEHEPWLDEEPAEDEVEDRDDDEGYFDLDDDFSS